MLRTCDIDDLRERSKKYAGAVAFRELTTPPPIDPVAVVMMKKAARADPVLFGVALEIAPEDPFNTYEQLGGCYSPKRK